jgi:hypothetical protein
LFGVKGNRLLQQNRHFTDPASFIVIVAAYWGHGRHLQVVTANADSAAHAKTAPHGRPQTPAALTYIRALLRRFEPACYVAVRCTISVGV